VGGEVAMAALIFEAGVGRRHRELEGQRQQLEKSQEESPLAAPVDRPPESPVEGAPKGKGHS
jgi:hypothetical protein